MTLREVTKYIHTTGDFTTQLGGGGVEQSRFSFHGEEKNPEQVTLGQCGQVKNKN